MKQQRTELVQKEENNLQKKPIVAEQKDKRDDSQYQKEYFSIKFERNDLIDLINEDNSGMTVVPSNNYCQFLNQRQLEIEKPQLIKEGYLTSYKLYRIKTKKRGKNEWQTVVTRRFNDFEYLNYQLLQNYGGYVIPRLPIKNFLAKLNLQTKQFQQERVHELRRYLERLLIHNRVRFSQQLKWFLFDEDYNFSSEKGEYIEQGGAMGIRAISESVLSLGKKIWAKYLSSKEVKNQFSKNSADQMELKLFSKEIEELVLVTKQMRETISYCLQQFDIIQEFGWDQQEAEEPFNNNNIKDLIDEFEEISQFVENCWEAIIRAKLLKQDVDSLQAEQGLISAKENENPRSRQLDTIRNKLIKYRRKYDKWIKSLKEQLQVYTKEGKTLMENFIKKFIARKWEIYDVLRKKNQLASQ